MDGWRNPSSNSKSPLVGRYRLTSGDFELDEGFLHPSMVREVHPPHTLGKGQDPHVTGLIHDSTGFPTNDPEGSERFLRDLYDKVVNHRDELCLYDLVNEDKGRACVVAYGSCARSASRRECGTRAGSAGGGSP